MNVSDRIAFQAKLQPEQPAIIAGNSIVTFGMLEGAVRAVAARIAPFGLPDRSIVGISIKSPARHLAVTLALMRMGHASAPFANEAALAILPELTMAIADQQVAMPAGRLCAVAGDDWFAPITAPIAARELAPTDISRIVMSSGTTGRPKPLLINTATLEYQIAGTEWQLTSAGHWSRGLVMMELSAAWSYHVTLQALTIGRTICFAANPEEALRVASLYGCEYIMGSVFHVRTLVEAQRRKFVPLPALKGLALGGSVITAQLLVEVQAMLTRRIVLSYGSSELGCAAVEIIGGEASVDGATGYVNPAVELQVVDEEDEPLPPGGMGRIRQRTPHMALSIDGRALEEDGWFYPGDVGHVDANGRLFITGRVTDLINVGGGKIAPERVEQVLIQHPSVTDVGVVGVRDEQGGDAIVAAIVAADGIDLEELAVFGAASFRAAPIARYVLVAEIPRGPSGKVVRTSLAQLVNA